MKINKENCPSVPDFPTLVLKEAREIVPADDKQALFEEAGEIAEKALEQIKDIFGEEERDKYFLAFRDRMTILTEQEERQITICENGTIKNKTININPSFHAFTASQLVRAEFAPLKIIVEDILKIGVCVLAAKSKMYKSWLCLQLAIAVAKGQMFLGKKTTKSDVLYIDLENDKRLSRERLIKLLDEEEAPSNLFIINDVPTMENGFSSALESFLEEYPSIHLVIIDVFTIIKYTKKSNQNDYDTDYKSISELKKIAEKYEASIVLVAHSRKMIDPTDPFSNIMGSTAMMGASDQAIVIHKENRSDKEATISITGRTVEAEDFKAEFDKSTCKWKLLGSVEDYEDKKKEEAYRSDPIVKTIKKAIRANGGKCSGRASDFIQDSKRFGCTIYGSSQSFNKKLEKLIPDLEYYDSIIYSTTLQGKGSIIHNFEQKIPFKD